MKRKFLTVILALVATLCLCFGLAACGGGGYGTEGTYYLVENDKYDTQTYFTLKGGKWTDEDGATGDYEIDGEKITFYTDFFGERIELTDGTLKDGILTVRDPGGNTVYAQEGAWKGAGGSQSGSEGGGQTPSAKEYTVTYDANGGVFAGGDGTFTQSVKEGAKLTAPASPARSNYSFAGWAKSKNGSEMWKFDEDAVSGNTTLYAQWTQESAVILSVEGASIEGREIFMLVDHATSTVSLSGKIVCSDDSIWRLYSDPEGQREIPTKMVTNLNSGKNTYYIVVNSQNQAQVNVYELTVHRSYLVTVSYYNGDALLKTEEVYTGDTFTASYTPDITGYTFNKWKTLGGEEFTSDVIWGTTALYADKTANTYKATLNVNGGDALTETEKTMTYDEEYTFPVPRRTGYSFAGWYVGSTQITNANGSSLSAWRYASAQNVTAHWQANEYAVTLKQNDENAGSVSGGGDHAYDSQVTITATTNKGYNFLGWYDKDDELVSDKAQYTFKMGFAVSYTAKWDYYTVTATRNNTSAGTLSKYYNAEKVSAGTKVTLTANTNKGYTFVGWYKGDEEVSKALSYQFTMGKENVSYEARWIACPVKVQSGDETAGTVKGLPDTTVLGQEVTLTATTNKGYTFVGWYKGDEEVSTELSYQITIGKENVIYEARWCKVTLRSANTSAGSVDSLDSTYKVGDEVTITATTNIGYVWVGWYIGENEVTAEPSYQYSMTKESVVFEARWTLDPAMSDYKFNSTTTTCTITGVKDLSKTEYIIPDYVTSITGGAFSGCNSVASITIPFVGDSKKTAGDTYQYPFGYIFGTTKFDGASAVEQNYYGSSTSSSTSSMYYIPNSLKSVTVTAGEILYGAFYNCSGLQSIEISDGVTSIGVGAFFRCSELTSVTIGSGVTSIGNYAFYGCSGLKSITIPFVGDSKKTAEDTYQYPFGYIFGTTKFDGASAVKQYYYGSTTSSTTSSTYYIPDSLKSVTVTGGEILRDAFYGCSGLTSITIPDSVTSIGSGAFSRCSGLTSITIPDSVTSIGESAFYGCFGLTSITIPDSVTSIGSGAFASCYKLVEVWNYSGLELQPGSSDYGQVAYYAKHVYTTDEGSKQTVTDDGYIFYEDGEEVYLLGYQGSDTALTLPATSPKGKSYKIYQLAFYCCLGLTSVVIPDSVTSIGDDAFYECDGLTSVTIGSGVTDIGDYAFEGCSGLTDIQFKGTVKEWQAIKKGYGWDSDTPDYTVTCTDGTIKYNGTVTYFE